MNVHELAQHRADCLARVEALLAYSGSDDLEEDRELRLAISRARAAYKCAEADFQTAISTYTAAELKAMGVAA